VYVVHQPLNMFMLQCSITFSDIEISLIGKMKQPLIQSLQNVKHSHVLLYMVFFEVAFDNQF